VKVQVPWKLQFSALGLFSHPVLNKEVKKFRN
jgi:hypothetical protein